MSNIFEALQHSQKFPSADEHAKPAPAMVDRLKTIVATTMEQEMVGMHRNIDSLLRDSPRKILQFIGSSPSEGVSTIVREYAALAVAKMGKSVLILDAAQGNGDQRNFFRINNNRGWDEAVTDFDAIEKTICRIGDSNLYVSCLSHPPGTIRQLFDSYRFKDFYECLKMRFDLVLVDSSPVTTAIDSIALSRCADGVVLVVEAEKTRWPVAMSVKESIMKNGGNILGMILNKRRFYIPKYIYSRL